jgi:hypothetical protein
MPAIPKGGRMYDIRLPADEEGIGRVDFGTR